MKAHIQLLGKGCEVILRRATAFRRVLPELFILGAPKAGSTTLADLVWSHPAHAPAMTKELMYLQQLPGFQSNYEFSRVAAFLWGRYANGHATYCLQGYRKFFPTKLAMRRLQRQWGVATTSDCDPFNLYCPVAMRRILEMGEDCRFIISLRNPIERAYSDYNMHRVRARDPRTFETAIDDELSGRESRFRKRFLFQSIYAPHLERWFAHFPRQSFLVIRAEELFEHPSLLAKRIFAFLRLSDAPVEMKALNVGEYQQDMEPATRSRLADYFRVHNERLYDLIGCNMQW